MVQTIPFLTRKVPLSYNFHRKWYPFYILTVEMYTASPVIRSVQATVFPTCTHFL